MALERGEQRAEEGGSSLANAEHMSPFQLQAMTAADIPEVLEIEQRCYSHPWREKTFADCLRAGYSCFVAVQQNVIKGYFVMLLALDEAQLLNICIDAHLHGSGKGLALLTELVEVAKRQGAQNIFLEVRRSNQRAIRLYEKFGFIEHGVRKGYYPLDGKQREDAVLMAMYC